MSMNKTLVSIAICAGVSVSLLPAGQAGDSVEEMLATGIQGGLVVHLGCGDGKLTAALRANDSYVIHGLDADAEQVAEALQQLDSDEAVYLLEDLDKEEQKDILAKLPYFERIALQRSLEYPEDSAGRIMQTDLIAVPPFWSVGQTIDYMRVADDLPDRFYEIFVVDPAYHLIGSVALNRLLRSRRPTTCRAPLRRCVPPSGCVATARASPTTWHRC